MRLQRRELAAELLGGGLVISVQHHGVTGAALADQPFDRSRILVEPVAALEPRRDQQRSRHVAERELGAKRVDLVDGAVPDPGDRDDQCSHTRSMATSGVQEVSYTWAEVDHPVFGPNEAARPRWHR